MCRYQYLPVCLMMIMWYTFRYQYLLVCLMMIMWYMCRYQYLPVCLMMIMWYTFRYQYLPVCVMMIMWYTFRYLYLPVCVMMIMWYMCRYQYFLQLTKDMSEGRLVAPFQTTVLLASLAVQCECPCIWHSLHRGVYCVVPLIIISLESDWFTSHVDCFSQCEFVGLEVI